MPDDSAKLIAGEFFPGMSLKPSLIFVWKSNCPYLATGSVEKIHFSSKSQLTVPNLARVLVLDMFLHLSRIFVIKAKSLPIASGSVR